MKLDFEDVFEKEDFETINTRERFDKELSPSDVQLSSDLPIVVRYDYVDLDKTDYHFFQQFTHEDTKGYFAKMRMFAGKSINNLLKESRSHHFYRSELKGNLLKAVKKLLPKSVDTNQIIYHFGLYDTERWGDRTTDSRCSRVYLMLGTYGQIYALFFDPYHELNPLPKQTSNSSKAHR